jgi:hypothetical protein
MRWLGWVLTALRRRVAVPGRDPAARGSQGVEVKWLAIALAMWAGSAHAGETMAEELAFQLVHLADTGQTLDIARHPGRWQEQGSICDARWAIGAHPSTGAVWAYMTAEAGLHAAVTVAIVHYGAPRWAIRTWEAVTIAVDAETVARNVSLGLRVTL